MECDNVFNTGAGKKINSVSLLHCTASQGSIMQVNSRSRTESMLDLAVAPESTL